MNDTSTSPYVKTPVLLLLALCHCQRSEEAASAGRAATELQIIGRRSQVGFDATVELRARLLRRSSEERWTIRWRHLWGPLGPGSPRVLGGATLKVRTRRPPASARVAKADGVIALSAADAGRVVYRVRASSSTGRALEQTVEIFPAFPSARWPRAAAGVDLYLARAGWMTLQGRMRVRPTRFAHLVRARWTPPSSEAGAAWSTLTRPARGAPHRALDIRGGAWLGSQDCGRYDCHPREHRGWLRTGHASVFRRGVEGKLSARRGRYDESCVACHTLGYQPGVDNDGFDDRARESGWRFPARPGPGSWSYLPRRVKERANVQCESCHGPGWFYVGYGEDVCAQCHDHPPQYMIVAQGRQNSMSRAQRSVAGQQQGKGKVCGQCHEAAGFLESLRGHRSGSRPGRDLEVRPRGVTCAACHDPHNNDCRRQLRLCGEVEIPGRTFDAGQGALCIACHTGEANVVQGSLHRPYVPGARGASPPRDGAPPAAGSGHGREPAYSRPPDAAPHAPQFQLLTGRGGRFLGIPTSAGPAPVYPHMNVPDSCVGCHYDRATRRSPGRGHTFKLVRRPRIEEQPRCASSIDLSRIRRSNVTRTCARCHGSLPSLNATARGDYDGDGAVRGIIDEIEGLLRALKQEIDRQIQAGGRGVTFTVAGERIVFADGTCRPLEGGPAVGAGAPALQKAAHNYLMVVRDGSGGLHNPQYTVRLLQDSLQGLEEARGARRQRRWGRPR